MRPGAVQGLTIAAVAAAALVVGAIAGWTLRPAPPPPDRSALAADVLETLEDMEKRCAGVVEILDDMVAGNVSPAVLEGVRDSMQEVVEAIGDVSSQVRQLSR